jgi:hypothetical protein
MTNEKSLNAAITRKIAKLENLRKIEKRLKLDYIEASLGVLRTEQDLDYLISQSVRRAKKKSKK